MLDQLFTFFNCQTTHGGHKGGSVDHGIPFFGNRLESGDTGLTHGLITGHQFPFEPGFTAVSPSVGIAGCHRRNCGQGHQISTGSQGTLFRDIRGDALVEHLHKCLNHYRSNTGRPASHGVGPDDHHSPHNGFGQWFANTGYIGQNDISGQDTGLVRIDGFIGVGTKAGIDTIKHRVPFLYGLNQPLVCGGHT